MKSFQAVETQNPPMVNHVRKHGARIAVGTNMSTHVVGTPCMIKVNDGRWLSMGGYRTETCLKGHKWQIRGVTNVYLVGSCGWGIFEARTVVHTNIPEVSVAESKCGASLQFDMVC